MKTVGKDGRIYWTPDEERRVCERALSILSEGNSLHRSMRAVLDEAQQILPPTRRRSFKVLTRSNRLWRRLEVMRRNTPRAPSIEEFSTRDLIDELSRRFTDLEAKVAGAKRFYTPTIAPVPKDPKPRKKVVVIGLRPNELPRVRDKLNGELDIKFITSDQVKNLRGGSRRNLPLGKLVVVTNWISHNATNKVRRLADREEIEYYSGAMSGLVRKLKEISTT